MQQAVELRLVQDACAAVSARVDPSEAGRCDSIELALSEIIAEQEVPRAIDATVESELGYLRKVDALVRERRKPKAASEFGEAIDDAALQSFLRGRLEDSSVEVVNSRTVSRGNSKRTIAVTLQGGRILPDEIILRMDKSSVNYLGTTIVDEYAPLRALAAHGARVPTMRGMDPTGAVLGAPFIIFDRAEGGQVGGMFVPAPYNPPLITDIARVLAEVHATPTEDWIRIERPEGRHHIDDEIDRYLADWQAVSHRSPVMDASFEWILANRDLAIGPPVLTHNDFNYHNMMIDGDRVTALLDWEFVHIGVAAADLAYFYYSAEGTSSFGHFLEAYEGAGGTVPPAAQLDFYRLWGQLRLAVMCFQVIGGLREGKFDDVRFASSRPAGRWTVLRLGELLQTLPGGTSH